MRTARQNSADPYLALLYDFSNGDAAARARIHDEVSTRAVLAPTAANRLQLALLKAWPGHNAYNPETAQRLLQAVTDDPDQLSAAERNLAAIYRTLTTELQTKESLARNNRTLTAELEEANKKLNALSTIERTLETSSPVAEVPEHTSESPATVITPPNDATEPAQDPAGR